MSNTTKTYWRGLEELQQTEEFVKSSKTEFADYLPITEESSQTYRRDFLKLMGFGVAAATLAACETPVRKAIPYLSKPDEVDPTIPNWYSSTYVDGGDYCSIVVKTREGRPIKIEGNKNSAITKGGMNARVAASVLSLYDKERYRAPKIAGKEVTWSELDTEVSSKLSQIAASGGQIRIVTNTIISPSLLAALAEFTSKYPTAQVVSYDANTASGILDANNASFGKAALPTYDFSKANIIVSFGADFLGSWIAPVAFTKQFSSNRKLSKEKKSISRLYQFESLMSLTGANADFRTTIKPSTEGLVVASLYNMLASKAGVPSISTSEVKDVKFLEKAANDLWSNKGKSLVVSGSNDTQVQILINAINVLLVNYGKTIDLANASNFRKGSDANMDKFIEELNAGSIGAVVFLNSNPVYNHPRGKEIKGALSKAILTVSTSDRPDETSVLVGAVAPDHHFLESWGDAEPIRGSFSLSQPTISPLFKTRQVLETFLIWSGKTNDAYTFVQSYWKQNILKGASLASWDLALHNGVYTAGADTTPVVTDSTAVAAVPSLEISGSQPTFNYNVSNLSSTISENYKVGNSLDYVVYEKVGMGTGSQANNPWLLEFPEPITKACWDNYVTVSQKLATEKSWIQGDVVKIDLTNGKSIELPVLIQPGQANNTLGFSIGFGREVTGKSALGVGKNAFATLSKLGSTYSYFGQVKSAEKVGENYPIAQTQTHHTMMARPIVAETSLSSYLKDPSSGIEKPKIKTSEGDKNPTDISIWGTKGLKTHDYNNHFWGLVIDLSSCTGCGACVTSCQSENNVPVVGKQEVLNRREMHWIRIDRYYSTDVPDEDKSISGYSLKEIPSDSPQVVFQPVMCQHCNNAPCETVCPVLATTHSTEGLNQMTYNRCVGTRYCANNCPYKVRRFNWFSYYTNEKFRDVNSSMFDDLGKMVLNPDVTVRARGVMEKCSMCVQRIQSGKLQAKIESRRPIDGEIETACSQSCPADALTFGDMNDADSRISKILADEKEGRFYHLLEEINVKPSVGYLSKIRNV